MIDMKGIEAIYKTAVTAAGGRRVTIMVQEAGLRALIWSRHDEHDLYVTTRDCESVDELWTAIRQIVAVKWPAKSDIAAEFGLNEDGTFRQAAAE